MQTTLEDHENPADDGGMREEAAGAVEGWLQREAQRPADAATLRAVAADIAADTSSVFREVTANQLRLLADKIEQAPEISATERASLRREVTRMSATFDRDAMTDEDVHSIELRFVQREPTTEDLTPFAVAVLRSLLDELEGGGGDNRGDG